MDSRPKGTLWCLDIHPSSVTPTLPCGRCRKVFVLHQAVVETGNTAGTLLRKRGLYQSKQGSRGQEGPHVWQELRESMQAPKCERNQEVPVGCVTIRYAL